LKKYNLDFLKINVKNIYALYVILINYIILKDRLYIYNIYLFFMDMWYWYFFIQW